MKFLFAGPIALAVRENNRQDSDIVQIATDVVSMAIVALLG